MTSMDLLSGQTLPRYCPAVIRRLRFLSLALVALFFASTALDAAVEVSSIPASADQPVAVPCAGLCGCHIGCVQADLAEPMTTDHSLAPHPIAPPTLAPDSRSPEISPPPPKQ
jgi:hypothetical protein